MHPMKMIHDLLVTLIVFVIVLICFIDCHVFSALDQNSVVCARLPQRLKTFC